MDQNTKDVLADLFDTAFYVSATNTSGRYAFRDVVAGGLDQNAKIPDHTTNNEVLAEFVTKLRAITAEKEVVEDNYTDNECLCPCCNCER